MLYQMPLERLAPKTQAAYVAAVAGLATCSHRSPDPLSPDQMRRSLHHVLVDRHRSWSSCHQGAWGRRFFSTKLLGWEPLSLHLPPRPAPSPRPQVLSVAARQRLCTRAQHPRHRVLLMTPYAAGLRVRAVVRLQLTDIESARGLIRVEQGQGRKERSTRLSTRLLTARRASWQLYRPTQWVFTGRDLHAPRPIGTAQHLSSHTKRTAGSTHGHGIHTLRHGCATHLLEAGVEVRTIHRWLGHRTLATPTRYLRITRQPRATVRSPFDLLPCGEPPQATPESSQATACHRWPRGARSAPSQHRTVGRRRYLSP